MAGLAGGVGGQVGLIGWLRWRILRNTLRTTRGQLEMAGTVISLALGALFALGGAIGLAAAAFALLEYGQFRFLAYLYWAVFAGWLLLPVMLAGFTVEFDFRHLLRFPLRFPAFYLLSLLYGLFDPTSLMALLWLAGLSLGVVLARPELAVWVLLAGMLFVLLNVCLNRLVFSWLEKLLARRRTREIMFVVFLLGVFGVQFVLIGADDRWEDLKTYLEPLAEWTWALPPGLAGMALEDAAEGRLAGALSAVALLGGYVLAMGWLLAARLRTQYRGEELGESRTAATADERQRYLRQAGWNLPGVSGPVAALVEKELRYLLRNTAMLATLFIPLLVFLLLAVSMGRGEELPGFVTRAPELVFPAAVAYALLVLSHLSYNAFAFDGRGVQLLLVAPVRFREVMLGKNLAAVPLLAAEFALIWLIISLVIGPPGAVSAAAALAAMLFAALLNFAVGNLLSLHYPRQFDFGKFRQRQSGMTALWTFLVQATLLGVLALVFGLAYWLGVLWLSVPVLLLLATGAFFFYRWSLEESSRLALAKREVLVAELCRD